MNLIIEACLSEPPTEVLPFRQLTWEAKSKIGASVLVECKPETKDMYWKFMKARGMLDFVEDILSVEEREKGTRLIPDYEINIFDYIPPSIEVNRIDFFNTYEIIEKLKRKSYNV